MGRQELGQLNRRTGQLVDAVLQPVPERVAAAFAPLLGQEVPGNVEPTAQKTHGVRPHHLFLDV